MIKSIFDTVPRLRADAGRVGGGWWGISVQIASPFSLPLFAICGRLIGSVFAPVVYL